MCRLQCYPDLSSTRQILDKGVRYLEIKKAEDLKQTYGDLKISTIIKKKEGK